MKLTEKLLSRLNRVFNKGPKDFLALRLRYDGSMTWSVEDGFLTTSILGGTGVALTISLSSYTLSTLASHLAAQPGYTVEYLDTTGHSGLSAMVLLDGAGNQNSSNGDHLRAYTSTLFALFDSFASEVSVLADEISSMLLQLTSSTAAGEWLDEHGSFYGITRISGEQDSVFANRIIAEVLRPRGNAVAIAASLSLSLGQNVEVENVVEYSSGGGATFYDGTFNFDGTQFYDSASTPRYCLFDVSIAYDLSSGSDMLAYADMVRQMVENIRDAGTQMRALSLLGTVPLTDSAASGDDGGSMMTGAVASALDDAAAAPTETMDGFACGLVALDESAVSGTEDASLALSFTTTFNGVRSYNGDIYYGSGEVLIDVLP